MRPRSRLGALALAAMLALSACAPAGPPSGPGTAAPILALGDSVMAWNGAAGIPEALAEGLGRRVVDRSRAGAHLSHPSDVAGALGFDISEKVPAPGWGWIVLTGGGNDLRDACKTPREAAALDALLGPGLRGEIPDLIARLRATGARVVFLGYYDGPSFAPTGFSRCQGAFDVMNARLERLAATDPGLLFLDAGPFVDTSERAAYARDLVHPSPRSSAAIGAALADLIAAAPPA